MAFIEFSKIHFSYRSDSPLLRNISLSIGKSERVLIAGTVGAGKSTLLKLAVGLHIPVTGTVRIDEIIPSKKTIHEVVKRIGVALQNPSDQIFSSTVREEILYGQRNLNKKEDSAALQRVAEMFNLSQILDKHPYDLHPAQRRLLTLASAIAMETPFYIFDEPTSGVSKPEKVLIGAMLNQLSAERKGYIVITHDLGFGMEYCQRIIVLNKGIIVLDEMVSDFLRRNDAQGILKANGLSMPVVPRMARMLELKNATASYQEFLSQLQKN